MAKYYFDLHNGGGFLKDNDGRELPDKLAAHKEAATILMDVAGDELNGFDPFSAKVTVRDHQAAVIFTATLSFRID
ncbi:DUF6894 family protein [Pararhizobium arenae]|uniref:DUF6894 family protein n=1 Tax=Pararhizobium arenae TaxID=1856850 RepID=UPI00094B61B5|nr:hypothetical protein [Pararhizobium arenae]